jgi:hypothetical protein
MIYYNKPQLMESLVIERTSITTPRFACLGMEFFGKDGLTSDTL